MDNVKIKFDPTIILGRDDLRNIFKLNKCDKSYPIQIKKQHTKFLKLIISNKVNVLFSVVSLFHELHKYIR